MLAGWNVRKLMTCQDLLQLPWNCIPPK